MAVVALTLAIGLLSGRDALGGTEPAQAKAGPPQMKAAAWTVLVEEPLALKLQARGTPVKGKTDKYQGYLIGSKDLMAMLKEGNATSQVLCVPRQMVWFANGPLLGEHSLYPWMLVEIIKNSTAGIRSAAFLLPSAYKLAARSRKVRLTWHGMAWGTLDDGQPIWSRARFRVAGSVNYSGELKDGEALVYLAPLAREDTSLPSFPGAPSPGEARATPTAPWQLIAAQAMEVGTEDAPYLGAFGDLGRWLQDGLEGALGTIREARAWESAAGPAPATESKWSHPVTPGGMLRVRAVGQPARWPFRWWNGDGQPIAGQLDWQKAAAGGRLTVYLEAQGIEGVIELTLKVPGYTGSVEGFGGNEVSKTSVPIDSLSLRPPNPEDNEKVTRLLEARTPVALTATYGEGDWQKIADIHEGEEIRADGGWFKLKPEPKDPPFWSGPTLVDADFDFDPNWAVAIVGVDDKGRRSPVPTSFGSHNYEKREGRRIYTQIRMKRSAIDHYEILKRPVRSHTFTGIAIAPTGKVGR